MKKAWLVIGLLIGLAAVPAMADWCFAVASECGATAATMVPEGGTCHSINFGFRATVIAFDSAGNVVGSDRVTCPIGPC